MDLKGVGRAYFNILFENHKEVFKPGISQYKSGALPQLSYSDVDVFVEEGHSAFLFDT
jgi:hypothetical protein